MVRTHLAAINGVEVTHGFLDKGVTGFALLGPATPGLGNINSVPGEPWIMNHDLIGRLGQKGRCEQADNVITLDKFTGVVVEETAIEIAIPGDTKVSPGVLDQLDGRYPVFLEHRIGHPIGKMSIGIVMQFDELKRKV